MLFAAIALMDDPISYTNSLSVNYSLPYAILAFVMIFYPLSEFIADICCNRLKIIMICLCFLLLFILMVWLTEILFLIFKLYNTKNVAELLQGKFHLISLVSLLLVIGLAGYQANYIHFGLDQLFEAPNHHLALFIHFAL